MTTAEKIDTARKPTADLVSQYRPLGLKAVLAAALQIKGKQPLRPVAPAKSPA